MIDNQLNTPEVSKDEGLEMERENANQKLDEIRRSIKKTALYLTAGYVFLLTLCSIISITLFSNSNIAFDLILATVGFLIGIFIEPRIILSKWRNLMTAKRDLRQWDLLITDYYDKLDTLNLNENKKIDRYDNSSTSPQS
jgi:hypothetical protein